MAQRHGSGEADMRTVEPSLILGGGVEPSPAPLPSAVPPDVPASTLCRRFSRSPAATTVPLSTGNRYIC